MTTPLAVRVMEADAFRYRRIWKGSVVTAFINPMLFLVAMGHGFGTLVDRGVSTTGGTVGYIAFIAPALLAATAMQTAANEAMWPVMAGFKWNRTYHAALATPIRIPDLVSGTIYWIAVRTLMACAAFALVAGLMGAAPPVRMFLAIPPAVLTGIAFATPLMAFTASTDKETRLSTILRFAIMPMFLFSGTFFPVEELPAWLQPVAYATPLWHGVDLCRALALDVPARMPWVIHVAYLLAWAGIGWALAARRFRKRLEI
ncbi:MAG TPA: ABC transporter permease [Actinomycetota bacterium]|nr:ABC transporter permease [Actinomycetota bacterium]